tara:strand:+ start:303 stop:869 length:567 start_codon:yes stop_codon:yes gene_type:complete
LFINPVYSKPNKRYIKKIQNHILNQNFDTALDLLEEISIKKFNYYYLKGRIYQDKKNDTEALINYTIALQYKPNNYKTYNNRALVKGSLKDLDGAMSDLNKSIEINPNYAESFINRGVTFNVLNEPKKALIDFAKAIEIDPKIPDAYLNRAITNQYLGNKNEVCPDLNKARDLGDKEVKKWIDILCKN